MDSGRSPRSFHSTRKVSRLARRVPGRCLPLGFHSTRKVSRLGFGECPNTLSIVSIPLGRFQGCSRGFIEALPRLVSIPLGRFQGTKKLSFTELPDFVSIPLGRFQGESSPAAKDVFMSSFHSTRKVSRWQGGG